MRLTQLQVRITGITTYKNKTLSILDTFTYFHFLKKYFGNISFPLSCLHLQELKENPN